MFELDRNSSIPLNMQLYNLLSEKINSGEYAPHDPLPSENELSTACNISRTTVRNVILKLTGEQMVYKVPGKGTFVSERRLVSKEILRYGICEQLESMGDETDANLIEQKIINANKGIAEKLNLKEGDPLMEIDSIRYVHGTPFSFNKVYLPVNLFPGLSEKNFRGISLRNMLETDYYVKERYREETLESVIVNEQEASNLELPDGFQILLAECTFYDEKNEPFKFSKCIFRGDRIKLKFVFGCQTV
jgi:GntR family transcriptional regulator